MAKGIIWKIIGIIVMAATLWGCGSTKHVPDGEMLLDHVKINVINDSLAGEKLQQSDFTNYLRQQPNHKVLGFWKLQLHTYSLSGRDSTKWYNRWLRRMGKPPVIYDHASTGQSIRQLKLALINRGYMNPQVYADTLSRPDKKKIDVIYNVRPGLPHRVNSIRYQIADSTVSDIIARDAGSFTLNPGDRLDRNLLESERTRLTDMLQNRGYYSFVKDYITFVADTAEGDRTVNLTMNVGNPPDRDKHQLYRVARVIFETDYQPGEEATAPTDTVRFRNITVVYDTDKKRPYIKPRMLWDNNYIEPGEVYSAQAVDRTYEALSRLGMVRSATVEMRRNNSHPGDSAVWLDAVVRLTRNTRQGISVELEGTNSEGDLGFGVGVTYQHRNLLHASELLTVKARGSYESLSGNLEGLINNHYTEAGAEVALTLPRFRAPFIKRSFRRKVLASTEFALNFNFQERPEYTRIIAGAGWKYKWSSRNNNTRKVLDVLDVSYVYLPHSTLNFLDEIAPSNPLLRYSYEDHFIMRLGFSYFKTNKANASLMATPGQTRRLQKNVYTLRASVESSGNLLYAISSAIGHHKSQGAYKIFGIQYAQYVKGEVDYMRAHNFDRRSSLAFHVGGGIGVPYGNSSMLPFEKRFYAGGANGVRGWGVRTLGPGRYNSTNSVTGFINQCGDIRLDLSLEYRVKLFWVFEGALFVDAGNIWTIRNYENQPDGLFRFDSFYKELAWAYGIGLRLDFNYFLLRFDLGMKAYNPAIGHQPWPLTHPRWNRDATFHFSVGYPF